MATDEPRFVACGLAVVHPWLCDAMGHLTTRHYLGMFDDASYQLFEMVGGGMHAPDAAGRGWADVRHEIDYRAELAAGETVRIEGRIAALGRRSLTAEFRLLAQRDDRLCAGLRATTVCFDLTARRARDLPEDLRRRARELFDLESE